MKHYSIATGFQRPEWLVHSTVRTQKFISGFSSLLTDVASGSSPSAGSEELPKIGAVGARGGGMLWEGQMGGARAQKVMGRVGSSRQRGPGCWALPSPLALVTWGPHPLPQGGPPGKDEKL